MIEQDFQKHFWKKSPYLRLQPDKARPEFPQLEPEKSGHDSIFVDLVGACWCYVHCCRRLAPQSFLPLLKKKKKNVPINFHFAKQVNSSANKRETDFFFRTFFLSNWLTQLKQKGSSESSLEIIAFNIFFNQAFRLIF